LREGDNLRGLADVDAMRRELDLVRLADLGGDRLQARLLTIGEREVGAARGQLQRQCAADAAGGPVTTAALPEIAVMSGHPTRARKRNSPPCLTPSSPTFSNRN
jgi:hypothetical protein